MSLVKDPKLSPSGLDKIAWVRDAMPVLASIEREFLITQPLRGLKMSISIHLEAKTAYLAMVLRSGGADVAVTGCNPLSTQDDVAAALVSEGFSVFAVHGASAPEYTAHLRAALAQRPNLIIDDGGDFVELLHGDCRPFASELLGGTEETTTGLHRLRMRAAAGKLDFPMLAVNDANCKYLFDNRYGTGQSVWDAIMHTTNYLVAGKTVVVAGYGWCGRGIAMRAAALGARVIITEIDPHRALEAAMDGHAVMTMEAAAPYGDFFVTATGCQDVIRRSHMERMKNNAILANAGHFDVEISKPDLLALAVEVTQRKPSIEGYRMADGRVLNLLAEGRLVNLAAGNGHPAEIMDLSFAIQALGTAYLAAHAKELKPALYPVPAQIDRRVAFYKLAAMGLSIDSLSDAQKKYLGLEGTESD